MFKIKVELKMDQKINLSSSDPYQQYRNSAELIVLNTK